MKLVQTGCGDYSPDIRLHRRLMGVTLPEDEEGITAPELFTYPASPHLAAKIDGRPLDLAHLIDCANKLTDHYDVVLVEGAGGLAVPLTENLLTVDFACAQNWPFVFVTSGKLGSINHAVLSLEALQRRGAELSAVIFNQCNPMPDATIEEDTREYMKRYCFSRFPRTLWLECPVFAPEEIG